MIGKIRGEKKSIYDEPMNKVLESLRTYSTEDPEFEKSMTQLERLSDMKAKTARKPVSSDTLVTAISGLLGILTIVAYEQKHVMGSKALGLIQRTR